VRTVFFQEGAILWAESSDAAHRFSDWLGARGHASEESVGRARALVRSGVCRFGEALLRAGAIGPAALGRAAEQFVTDVIVSAFVWRDGRYRVSPFRSGARSFEPPVHVTAPLAAEAIVIEGYRAMTDLGLATLWLGDQNANRTLAADPFRYVDALRLTEAHAPLLRRLSASVFTVTEAVAASPLDPPETLRLLGVLDALGVIARV
jgi:hypothetical protein